MKTISLQEQRREYYSKNREYIKTKSAKYYAENKQRILERLKQKHKLNPYPARKRAKEFSKKNPSRIKKYQRTWKERHPEKRKLYTRNSRIRKYGIEPKEYYEMLEKQGHGCAICGAKSTNRAMSIDHNHKTGKVRGLLCSDCNLLVGQLERKTVEKAKQYLAKYK